LAKFYFHENGTLSTEAKVTRQYKLRRRAEAQHRTRERILEATMQLHDEQGVAPTTLTQVARRAGVGPATVFRHFPTVNHLVQACGQHVWAEMRPPTPQDAPAAFAGIETTRGRLAKLIDELDDFYNRGSLRLGLASRDRELLPELHGFLSAVEAGVEALVREALAKSDAKEEEIQVVIALTGFPVWTALNRLGLPRAELAGVKVQFLECAMRATGGRGERRN
jgi:AcrR family transcriptional regulator